MAFVGKCNNKPSTTYDTSANFSGLLAYYALVLRSNYYVKLLTVKNKIQNYACGFKRKAYIAVTAANDTRPYKELKRKKERKEKKKSL